MKTKFLFIITLVFSVQFSIAQVGVGTTEPKASLDIASSDVTNPSSTDGLLIPKIDNFPTTNPGPDQDGMMVYVTGNGAPTKGFYYWDNGISTWVNIQGIQDTDWLGSGTGAPADNITDNIYTLGQVQIGSVSATNTSSLRVTSDLSSNFTGLQLLHSGSDAGEIGYGIYNQSTISDAIRFTNFYNVNSGTHNSAHYGFENFFINNGTGEKVGLYNEFDISAPNGNKKGVYNRFEGGNGAVFGIDNSMPPAWSITGTVYGINNNIRSNGNSQHYGVRTELAGLGSGNKYGYFVDISSTAGGTHYGIFSDVRNVSGFAAYFRGRVSFGTDGINRYFMPTQDGSTNQVITTDGLGQLSFVDASSVFMDTNTDEQNLLAPTLTGTTLNLNIENGTGTSIDLASLTNDNDWVTAGANIERQSGDVYIGNTNATNNNIFISNNIIDWDDTNYYLNPDDTSVVDEIQFDNGTAADPSIRFQDINTGFFSPTNAVTAYSVNGNESFRIQNDGEISIGLTGATNYKFSLNSLVNQNTIRIGNDVSSTDNFVDINHGAQRGNAMNISVNDSYSLASRSGISVFNELGDTNVDIAKYATGSSNIYGLEIYIPEDIVGTEYGVYSNVLTTNGYAAYFLGEVSLGTTTGNTYILPNSRGTNGQVMQTDGSGNVTWQNPNAGTDNQQIDTFSFNSSTNELTLEIEDDGQAAQVVDLSSLNPQKAMARMFMNTAQTESGSGITKVNFDNTEFDIGNNFNTTTDEYVIPQTGIYRVTAQITMDASTGTGVFDVRIRVNGTQQRRAEYNHTGNGQILRQITSLISLTAGDSIDIAFSRPAIGATIQANSRASFFEIEQL